MGGAGGRGRARFPGGGGAGSRGCMWLWLSRRVLSQHGEVETTEQPGDKRSRPLSNVEHLTLGVVVR